MSKYDFINPILSMFIILSEHRQNVIVVFVCILVTVVIVFIFVIVVIVAIVVIVVIVIDRLRLDKSFG